MASEPSEEAIENFVSFTSTTREQAISFLKVTTGQMYTDFSIANAAWFFSDRRMTSTRTKPSMPTSKIRQGLKYR